MTFRISPVGAAVIKVIAVFIAMAIGDTIGRHWRGRRRGARRS